ncbi:tellurite resistance TerB family protein [Mangrovibrevibacter kandeliae]|uniref:tellurite resistance TerB family protein n=1 Tax=Mangrovibrevibacter kandeliae TaxID=2968473 RepID=UPI00211758C6|nr:MULTISPECIES: TerB family tellurite resistance protein [unclassified Aurantimonas]MCQ8781942.1 TerB family tellurite resistance protein [Aurantimonas sp. CSK15Z-1]MCW4115400.1 TerB family tellurite resistance protein [Aurantimonas sp. MSK8Z-1]
MLDGFKEFLRGLGEVHSDAAAYGMDDVRVAAAALLFHVGSADGVVTEEERRLLRVLLADEFGLDPREAERIARAGREADAEAVDLFHFTSIVKNHLDEDRRIRFVELLWDMTYADGSVHELEDNLVWRIAELIGVSSRDRMLMKQRVAARSSGAEPT